MDIEKLKILSKKASEAGELVRAVTAFKNELKDKEHMHDITMSGHFKTLREPLLEQQKKTDEKQDKMIAEIQKNQLALTSGIKSLMPPPWDESADLAPASPQEFSGSDYKSPPTSPGEFSESQPSTSQKTSDGTKDLPVLYADVEKFWDSNLRKLLKSHNLKDAQQLYQLSLDELTKYQKNAESLQSWAGNQLKGSQKNKDMDQINKNIESAKIYATSVHGLLQAKRHSTTPPKKGKGLKQPKRNAYKIQDGSYGGLLIDLPKLMNEMKIDVFRGGKLLYSADADKSLIDLLTKRFNPKTKYSINAVKIFNDLNTLANLPKHRSSGKTRMVGSSVTYYNDPNQLADRMKVLIGSMAAGNNSPLNINDLSQINDELLRIGAIDSSLHEKFFKKYLSQ